MSTTPATETPTTTNEATGATVSEMLDAVDRARTVSFPLGQLFITPGARDALAALGVSPQSLLDRHRRGEWGDLTEGDRVLNDAALVDGSRIFSSYQVEGLPGGKVWIITEAEDDDGDRA